MASITTTLVATPLVQIASSSPASASAPNATPQSAISPSATTSPLLSPSILSPSNVMSQSPPTATNVPTPLSSGLSTGAKAGIAAACAVAFVVLVSLCICLHISYRKRRESTYRQRHEKETALGAYGAAFQNTHKENQEGEGGAPLLRDGSYMDLSMQSGSSLHGSPNVGSDYGGSPGKFEQNTGYKSSHWLSPSGDLSPGASEKSRWRESHSIAGYFDNKSTTLSTSAEDIQSPRLSTGDKMVAEWRQMEIERAREKEREGKEREKTKEPHPMADYQNALPPFFPRGFRDISGDISERVPLGDHYLDPEVHEMDVGEEGAHRGR